MSFCDVLVLDKEFRELLKQVWSFESTPHEKEFLERALEKAIRKTFLGKTVDVGDAEKVYLNVEGQRLQKAESLLLPDALTKATDNMHAIKRVCEALVSRHSDIAKAFWDVHKEDAKRICDQTLLEMEKAVDQKIMEFIAKQPYENKEILVSSLVERGLMTDDQAVALLETEHRKERHEGVV